MFVGTLVDADVATGRFAIDQIRAGTLDGYAVGSFVDVRYDDDIRFLRTGEQYLVGVAPDRLTAVLSSKVRVPPLLFGGDAVIGADDVEVDCPRIEDGVGRCGSMAPVSTRACSRHSRRRSDHR